jgi:hypothetical protein
MYFSNRLARSATKLSEACQMILPHIVRKFRWVDVVWAHSFHGVSLENLALVDSDAAAKISEFVSVE